MSIEPPCPRSHPARARHQARLTPADGPASGGPPPWRYPLLPPLLPKLVRPGDGPSIPFVDGHLHLALSVVAPDALRPVTEDELLEWDHAFHHLCDHALLHLRGRMRTQELTPIETLPGIWQVRTTDGLAASRLLCLADLLQPWPLEGAVVCCPGPDQLLVVPLEGLACLPALQSLLRRAARARFEPGALSDQLFWCDDLGRWHHLPVVHDQEGVDMLPPPSLLSALERAAAIDLVGVAAEA